MKEMSYEIPGFRIKKQSVEELPKFGYVLYESLFCEFALATDMMGTQFCSNGAFFGPFGFKTMEEAVAWMNADKKRPKEARKFFTKVWWNGWRYTLSNDRFGHLYWEIRHRINPDFYLHGEEENSFYIASSWILSTILILLITL